jgi:putative membrane protein
MRASRLVRAAGRIASSSAGIAAGTAFAHIEQASDADVAALLSWSFPPDIVIGLLIVAGLYAAGLWRHRNRKSAASRWKHVSFFSGLAALFIALASPLDTLADRLFFMHQVQHLLLQTAGPMLLMVATPQALLVAGIPAVLQRRFLAPLLSSRTVGALFGFLARPAVATLLVVASLYIWQWPPYHDLSILNNGVHYFMHITMLAAGLLFYAIVFDPRPAPLAPSYGTRIVILVFAMTANTLLGASLALKESVLYSAYDLTGRLWGFDALTDERLGGLIIWIPGGALCVPAFLMVLRMWGARETQVDIRRKRGIAPKTAAQAGNHSIVYWLAFTAIVAFAGTISVGVLALG